MRCEAKVVCRFCSHEFWVNVEADRPGGLYHLFIARCPCNGSSFLFRLVNNRPEPWDEARVFQAVEWRSVDRFSGTFPVASAFVETPDMSQR